MATDFTTLIETALQDMPGVEATERIDAADSGNSGEMTIELEGGRIFRVTYSYDKRLSYDPQGECYNPATK